VNINSIFISAIIFASALVLVTGCNKHSPANPTQSGEVSAVAEESKKLETVSPAALTSLKIGSVSEMQPMIEFSKAGQGVAFIEPYDGMHRVIFNGRAGKSYQTISNLAVSRDGKRIAYVAFHSDKFRRIVVDGWEGPLFDDIGMPEFSPDSRHLLYDVKQGDITRLAIDNRVISEYQLDRNPVFSSDSSSIAFSVKSTDGTSSRLIISNIALQNKTLFDSCGEFFVKSDDSSKLAVVCSEGEKKYVKVIDFEKRIIISSSQAHDRIASLKFAAHALTPVYTIVKNNEQRYIAYNGREEMIPAGDELFSDPLLLSDSQEVGVIIGTAVKARLYKAFHKVNRNEQEYSYISDFVASQDGRHHAYVAVKTNDDRRLIVVDGFEGPLFDKIVDPLFSPDGRLLVYRARQSGNRFIVVSDLKGKIIRQHRAYDMVFHQTFTKEGKSVAYGVLDGNDLWWKVETL
jgi:hypothetical protein